MRVIGGKRLDDLFERARSAGNTGAETIAELDQLADKGVEIRAFTAVQRPAAFQQRADRLFRIGCNVVARSHLAVLAVEPHAKSPGALFEGALATFENVADVLAHIRVFEAT